MGIQAHAPKGIVSHISIFWLRKPDGLPQVYVGRWCFDVTLACAHIQPLEVCTHNQACTMVLASQNNFAMVEKGGLISIAFVCYHTVSCLVQSVTYSALRETVRGQT